MGVVSVVVSLVKVCVVEVLVLVLVTSQLDCPINPLIAPLSEILSEHAFLPVHIPKFVFHVKPAEHPANFTAS